MAERGPVEGEPRYVTSFASFLRQFGGYLSEFAYGEYRYLAGSVEQFFANGGTKCFVSRVIAPGAKSAAVSAGILKAEAKNEGTWGNRIQIKIASSFKKKLQLIKKQEDGSFLAKNIRGFTEGDFVVYEGEYNRIQTIFEDKITFEKDFAADPCDDSFVPKKVLYLLEIDVSVCCNEEREKYGELSFNLSSPNYILGKMEKSSLIHVSLTGETEFLNPFEGIFGTGKTEGVLTLAGGSDGNIDGVTAGTFIGTDRGPGRRTGIQAFLENDQVNMLCVPGITIPEVIAALVSHCENLGSRFAILDMPKEEAGTKELIEYREMIDSTYGAMYHPWVQIFDRSLQKPEYFPPSGAVMGIYARSDLQRGVHKAPANETVMCTGLNILFSRAEQDILNPAGINLIRRIPGQGIRVWGARTAGSNSSFKYVNVRRLFIYVEESIKANTGWVVFEPNTPALWTRVRISITGFLDTMYRSGMLSGSTPEESYFVEIGPSTMTNDDISKGRFICNIGIAPSRPAEFVIFKVTQFTAEAGAES